MTLITILGLAGGLALLIIGAEALVKGASKIASALGISSVVIGLTVVAFGTSSPELAVCLQSVFKGQPDIALGNAVGSNILNILFILGIASMITPLVVAPQLIKLDVPLMIFVSFLLFLFGLNGSIGLFEGVILFVGLTVYLTYLITHSRKESKKFRELRKSEIDNKQRGIKDWLINIGLVVAGLIMLVIGSDLLLDAAITIARAFGVSELIIGLTIIAAGTSLPEVFTSVVASLRGEKDIAVGNLVGSNIFNIMAIIGLTSIFSPNGIRVSPDALNFDIPIMIGVAIICFPIFYTGNIVSRWEGALLFFYYLVYTAFLILRTTNNKMLASFDTIILTFILPLTVLTLLVVSYKSFRKQHKGL